MSSLADMINICYNFWDHSPFNLNRPFLTKRIVAVHDLFDAFVFGCVSMTCIYLLVFIFVSN